MPILDLAGLDLKFLEEFIEKNKERLAEIREQLKENKDAEGNELDTMDITIDEDVMEIMRAVTEKYDITLNELIWLILEKSIENLKEAVKKDPQ